MIYWIIGILIWLVGAVVAYTMATSKWEGRSKAEQIYFAIIWPLLLLLYPIHFIHNLVKKDE